MFREKVLCSVFLAILIVSDIELISAAEQRGIISSVPDGSKSYCFLRFPAIKEDTLYWPQPVLKDPSSGDIVSFYGPCDYDPLGSAEVRRQRDEYRRRQNRLPNGD